jgi:Ca2+-binding EF-hand superfamily protein
LAKINEALKREAITKEELFSRIDVNGNAVLEKLELVTFFSKELFVKGLSFPDDIELLFDALDTNRDGLISVNEFCLCIDGVQRSI